MLQKKAVAKFYYLISVQVLLRCHGQGCLRSALASAFGVGTTENDSGDADFIGYVATVAGNDANRDDDDGSDAFLQLKRGQ